MTEPNIADINDKLNIIKKLVGEVCIMLKYVDKNQKTQSTKRKRTEKKRHITEPLAKLINLSPNDKITRSEGIRLIAKYAKEQNLQNPERKTHFYINNYLSELFNLKVGDQITFLSINHHISKLFLN
tara:strand:- start:7280 stop:7660 length:381 start_codon:yes stop_codon:yes gene_type:complete